MRLKYINDEYIVDVDTTKCYHKSNEVIELFVSNGGSIEPVHTADEIQANEKAKQVAQALAYLADSDFYFTVDKYATLSEDKKEELTQKRANARLIVNGVSL